MGPNMGPGPFSLTLGSNLGHNHHGVSENWNKFSQTLRIFLFHETWPTKHCSSQKQRICKVMQGACIYCALLSAYFRKIEE